MKKSTKLLSLLLALLFVTALLVSCGSPAETTVAKKNETAETDTETKLSDEVPTDLNYSNLSETERTITFFGRNNQDFYKTEICCEEFGTSIINEAVHYRNIEIEQRLGVKIKQILADCTESGGVWQTWNQTLSTAVLLNTSDYDCATINAYCGSQLAQKNIYKNLYTCCTEYGGGYLDLTKPWWNQKTVDELSYCGSLFFVGTSLCTTEIQNAYCIYFNKNLFNTLYSDENYADLYDYVNNYQWTIDKLTNYVSGAYREQSGDGEPGDGDILGWIFDTRYATMSTWVYAMGLKFTNRNQYGEIELSYTKDPNIVDIWEKVMKLYGRNDENPGTVKTNTDGAITQTGMGLGNLLFQINYLSKGEGLRNTDVIYGVLPVPMYNEEQGEYITNCATNASMFTILSNLSSERTEMVTAVAEVMAAKTYNDVLPKYYSQVLQGIYSKDQPDAEQYDRILNSLMMDFGICMFPKNGALQDYSTLFKNFSESFDIAQAIDAKEVVWESGLEALLEELEAAADRSLETK